MNWIIAQSNLPGEETAQQILQAPPTQSLLLVVVVIAIGWAFSTWQNGRAVSQMSNTQREMSKTNERFIDATTKHTTTLQASVDQQKISNDGQKQMLESFDRHQTLNQQSIDNLAVNIKLHDEHATQNAKQILDQLTDITNLLGEAVVNVNDATAKQLEPIIQAIADLKTAATAIPEALQTVQQRQMDTLKKQQDDQMDLLKAQYEEQLRILNEALDRAVRRVITSINLTGASSNENTVPQSPSPAAEPVVTLGPVPIPVDDSPGAVPGGVIP